MSIYVAVQQGDDALQNQFEFVIPPFPGAIDNIGASIRVASFDIPEIVIGTYERHYKTQKFEKPSGKIETANEISFNFDMDKSFTIYNGFRNWINIVGDSKTGIMTSDYVAGVASFRVPIVVFSVDSAGDRTGGEWTFEGAFIKSLGTVSYDKTSGDPIECSAILSFIAMV